MSARSVVRASFVLALACAVPALGQDKKDDEDAKVRRALDANVSLSLEDCPLADALDFVHSMAGVNVVVDPAVDGTTPFKMKVGLTKLRQILDYMASFNDDWSYEVYRGTVYFTSKKSGKKAPPKPSLTDAAKKAESKKVSIDLKGASLEDVATALAKESGAKFTVDSAAKGKVTVALKDLSFGAALDVSTEDRLPEGRKASEERGRDDLADRRARGRAKGEVRRGIRSTAQARVVRAPGERLRRGDRSPRRAPRRRGAQRAGRGSTPRSPGPGRR